MVDPAVDAPARVAARHILAAYDDPTALAELANADVVTFEFENVQEAAVRQLAAKTAVFPSARALAVAQERFAEKSTFVELGIATPRFARVDGPDEARAAFADLGPLVLKTRRGGYDGKGQRVVRDAAQLEAAIGAFGTIPLIAEELVSFSRELSVIVCRGRDGQSVVYPLAENSHEAGILRVSIAPAPRLDDELREQAEGWARRLVEHFDYVGVLALELFEVNGQLLANEFAPRVHNSGHWTIEGAHTSQFENHVRAVCGLPLGEAGAISPSAMINCIGAMPDAAAVLRVADAHLHDYGKEPRAARKVGHLTVRAPNLATLEARIAELRALLPDLGADS